MDTRDGGVLVLYDLCRVCNKPSSTGLGSCVIICYNLPDDLRSLGTRKVREMVLRMEQYYLCECGEEYDYPKKYLIDDADTDRCPECGKPTEFYSECKTYDERRL